MNNQDHEQFLKTVDEIDLLNRIKEFRKLNIKNLSDKEIADAILSVLSYNGRVSYIINIRKYFKGTKFFRVRILEGSSVPNKNLSKLSDFWNPPEICVKKYGRLNKPGESLLYTTPINPYIAINEMKLTKDMYYALIQYEAKEEIKVNLIGGDYNYDELRITDKKSIMVNELLNDFLRTEFSRDVGEGTEFLYKTSEIIAKWWFDLPPLEVQDAWAYSSVQNKEFYNVCFRPEIAKKLLELKGAMIVRNDDPTKINVVCVAHGFDKNNVALFYPLGSDIQKQYFPEIIINN